MKDQAPLKHKAFYRLRGLIIKEFHQIFRDPSNILIAFILPSILLIIYSFGVSLDYKNLKIGLVLEDRNNQAVSLAEAFESSLYFSVQRSSDFKELERELVAGRIKGIVVIPSYFSQYLDRRTQQAPIMVIADGSDPNAANFVQNYSRGVWDNWMKSLPTTQQSERTFRVTTTPRFWFNEELQSHYFLVPGSIAIIMTLIGTLLTALVIAREWERGTMEALMATPVTAKEIIMSKLIPYFTLGMGSMVFCVLFAIFIVGVPFRGSYIALILVSSLFLLAALSAGLMISSVSHSQFVAYQLAVVTGFLPSFMLSGFLFEISSMPLPIQWITILIPARYFVSSLQTLFLVGDIWPLLLRDMLFMALFAAFLFTLTLRKSAKRLE